MPHRRRVQKGSFGSHFDELVVRFPSDEAAREKSSAARSAELQQKIDIHAALFELAWEVDPKTSP